jgi:S1-C subfamily serine protease
VVAGKMSRWPSSNGGVLNSNLSKIHLNEMIFSSVIGDEITLWYIRPSQGSVPKDSLRVMTNTIANDMISPLPHIGLYQKPDYEYWGDFIVQDFNEFNVRLYRVPVPEVVAGGVLVTYVEPNSLASHAGLEMSNRFTSGRYRGGRSAARGASRWFIIEKVNGTPVSDLAGFRSALRNAEKAFVALLASAGYRPERKPLYPQRYTQLGIRTNTDEGKILHFDATFPVDEAMEFGETKN